jgi:transposase
MCHNEAHFDWRLRPRLGYSSRGRRLHTVRRTTTGPRSYSITMITSLTCERGYAISDPRVDTNNAWDFLEFLLHQIVDGRLVEGDTLICDNASIHNANDTLGIINDIFTQRGMRLIFLPKYSPELNPCELIWSQMKRYIRSHITNTSSLLHAIVLSCIQVTWNDVYGYYTPCLYNF